MNLRVITLNTRHGEVENGIIDGIKQATEIKKYNPDVVLLQEVDMYTDRVNQIDELQIFRNVTGLQYTTFGSNIDFANGGYGNAILSKYPILKSENYINTKFIKENRGILYIEISINGKKVEIFNTHFPVRENERLLFSKQINRIVENKKGNDVIIGGDFNLGLVPIAKHVYEVKVKDKYEEFEELKKNFKDAYFEEMTYPVENVEGQLDKIMYNGTLKLKEVKRLDDKISDHYPVMADFEFSEI